MLTRLKNVFAQAGGGFLKGFHQEYQDRLMAERAASQPVAHGAAHEGRAAWLGRKIGKAAYYAAPNHPPERNRF